LHPPLIVLMRQVAEDLYFKNYHIKKGDMVWASPPVTHRMSHLFENPEQFDPDRFTPERAADKNLMAYQPFGGGKHKCSGNAFALFQIKAIFAVLLRRYDFELVNAADSYVDNYKEMIVQPKAPCLIGFSRRSADSFSSRYGSAGTPKQKNTAEGVCPVDHAAMQKANTFSIAVDQQLCQGHAMCMGEAPELFRVDDKNINHVLISNPDISLLDKAQAAARHCPNQAITIKTNS
jgi:sterol 14alpha-demethylase